MLGNYLLIFSLLITATTSLYLDSNALSKPESTVATSSDVDVLGYERVGKKLERLLREEWDNPTSVAAPGGEEKIAIQFDSCSCREKNCTCCIFFNADSAQSTGTQVCALANMTTTSLGADLALTMGGMEIMRRYISAKDIPHLCLPVGPVEICLRFYELGLPRDSVQLCLDLGLNYLGTPLVDLHLNCLRIGYNPPGLKFVPLRKKTKVSRQV